MIPVLNSISEASFSVLVESCHMCKYVSIVSNIFVSRVDIEAHLTKDYTET